MQHFTNGLIGLLIGLTASQFWVVIPKLHAEEMKAIAKCYQGATQHD